MSPRSRKGGRGSNRSQNNRRRNQNQRPQGVGFWGDASKLPEASNVVRSTEDPAAVARSLGPPPLAGHETIAEHYFSAVYDRAVMLAGALAAAAGMNDLAGSADDT